MKGVPSHHVRRASLLLGLGVGLGLVFALLFMAIRSQPAAARSITASPPVANPSSPLAVARPPVARPVAQPPLAPLAAPGQPCYRTNILQVTNTGSGVTNEHPSISANGSRIAFASDQDGNYDIFLYDGIVPPTNVISAIIGVTNEQPSISGNGNYIAFVSNGNLTGGNTDGNTEIFRYDHTTFTTQQVTFSPAAFFPCCNLAPSINANGTRIAFVSDHNLTGDNPDINYEIFRAEVGINIIQVTSSTLGTSSQPSISGDGNRIAFVSDEDGNPEIFLYDATTGISQVTHTGSGVTNEQPSITSDGHYIAFASNGNEAGDNADGNREIFLYDGSSITQITNSTLGTNSQPSISDDGERIAFASNNDLVTGDNTDANQEIFVAVLDPAPITFDQVTVTADPVVNSHPSMDEFGSRVAFVSNGDLTGDNTEGNPEIFLAECGLIDLTLTKTAAPSPAQLWQPLTYTIVITNNSLYASAGVTLTDVLPPDVNFVSTASDPPGVACGPPNGVVTCTFGPLAGGGNQTVTIVVSPTKLTLLPNTATVSGAETDREESNNTVSITTEVRTVAHLEITKSVVPTQTKKGEPLTYTIMITNTGPYTATDVTLSDALPAKVFPQTVITDDASNNFGGGTHSGTEVSGNVLRLAAGNDSGQFTRSTIDAQTPIHWNKISWIPQRPLGKELPDNGRTESGYPDGNVNMSDNVLLMHFNELINYYSYPYPYPPYYNRYYYSPDSSGKNHHAYCYNYEWESYYYCPSAGYTGKFSTALRFDGVDDHVTINQADVDAPWTAEFWVKREDASDGSAVLLSSSAYSLKLEQWPNTNKVGITRFGVADYVFNYTAPIGVWTHLVFVGTSTQTDLYVNGLLQEHLAVGIKLPMSIMGSRDGNADSLKGTLDEVALYNRALLAQEIQDRYLRGALRLNLQVRSCDDSDCNGEQFIGPDGTSTTSYSELNNKSTTLPSFSLNVPSNRYFQYRVELEKDSDTSLSPELGSVMITHDDIESLVVVADPPMTCTKGRTIICHLPELAQNVGKTVQIRATSTTAAQIINTAQVTSTAYEEGTEDFIDVSATASTTINDVDLSVTKSAPSTALAGSILAYTIIATNNSITDTASEVVITDTLPLGVDFLSASPEGCDESGGIVTCNFEELGPGLDEIVTILIRPTEDGNFVNEVEVRAANPDPDTSNNEYTATTTVEAATDLAVQKSASSTSVTVGELLTYTITVNNAGPMNAGSVTLTDTLVADMPIAIVSTTGICNPGAGNAITCTFVGSLDKGAEMSVTIVISPTQEGVITNTVEVASNLADANLANNTATIVTGGGGRVYLPIIMRDQ